MTTVPDFIRPGPAKSWKAEGQNVVFEGESGAKLVITVLTATTVRVRLAPDGILAPPRSWSVVRPDEDFPAIPFEANAEQDTCVISTGQLVLKLHLPSVHLTVLDKQGRIICDDAEGAGWSEETGSVRWSKRIPANEHYYGFGERTGMLDKLGRSYTNYSVDKSGHGPATDMMYQAIPFFMALRPGEQMGYGFYFNNSYRATFDMGRIRAGAYSFSAEGGPLDYYLFYGPTPAQIVESYTTLTGRMELPPLWALGYHQSRYSYFPDTQVREIAQQFRERAIPCDVIVLDIHYMDGYRVFTWHPERFPDPAGLINEIAEQGFKLVTIIDPGVKYDPEGAYSVFQSGLEEKVYLRKPQQEAGAELEQAESDDLYLHGRVWPGDCLFPDFTREAVRKWWAKEHQPHLKQGVAGIWNDMNEPAVFAPPPLTGTIDFPKDAPVGEGQNDETTWAEAHNLYGLLENMATHEGLLMARPDNRPFILTRSGFAGIQKYAAVWTGDNHSLWEHLEMALPMLSGLGLSGVAFCGTDIGGFVGNASAELFARWMQIGALFPFARGHSEVRSELHEPWVFGKHVEDISRRYLQLRYRLLPYLYTLFEEATRSGAPVLRPLLYHFPDDPVTTHLHDQVLLGSALMAAPVYRPGRVRREVYLPEGSWYDFWAGGDSEPLHGPAELLVSAPLDTLPLYVRGGSIIPFLPEVIQHTGELDPSKPVNYAIYPDENGNAAGEHYEDAGEGYAYRQGEWRRTSLTCRRNESSGLRVEISSKGAYKTGRKQVNLWLPASLSLSRANLLNAAAPELTVSPDTENGGLLVSLPVTDEAASWVIELS